uniref:Uncharacterized protein n=1 Tax=Mycena chlorophos TaxID=658473 RepID=A0ABQ0LR45_MYCCL|nr:predicted protein [Mycena chlorophos]
MDADDKPEREGSVENKEELAEEDDEEKDKVEGEEENQEPKLLDPRDNAAHPSQPVWLVLERQKCRRCVSCNSSSHCCVTLPSMPTPTPSSLGCEPSTLSPNDDSAPSTPIPAPTSPPEASADATHCLPHHRKRCAPPPPPPRSLQQPRRRSIPVQSPPQPEPEPEQVEAESVIEEEELVEEPEDADDEQAVEEEPAAIPPPRPAEHWRSILPPPRSVPVPPSALPALRKDVEEEEDDHERDGLDGGWGDEDGDHHTEEEEALPPPSARLNDDRRERYRGPCRRGRFQLRLRLFPSLRRKTNKTSRSRFLRIPRYRGRDWSTSESSIDPPLLLLKNNTPTMPGLSLLRLLRQPCRTPDPARLLPRAADIEGQMGC